jgi:hypothetical protein
MARDKNLLMPPDAALRVTRLANDSAVQPIVKTKSPSLKLKPGFTFS